MENKELKNGLNGSIEGLEEVIVEQQTENNEVDFNDIKNSFKKKQDHRSCKGCDGICCTKKNIDKLQINR